MMFALYGFVTLFIAVVLVAFLFKAIAFMDRKVENDRERNKTLQELLLHLQKEK